MKRSVDRSREDGFTLIELLVIIGIIGILSSLGLTSYTFYKSSAAVAVIETNIHDARNAFEAGVVDSDNLPASVPLTTQTSQGVLTNAQAFALLPGFKVPSQTAFSVNYDNTCNNGACTLVFLQSKHCSGDEYIQWQRAGDGIELKLNIAGAGCS